MEVFEMFVAMPLGGAALAAVARRVGAPYPALVALAGAALALIPGVPALVLDPELALTLFVAPATPPFSTWRKSSTGRNSAGHSSTMRGGGQAVRHSPAIERQGDTKGRTACASVSRWKHRLHARAPYGLDDN